MLTSDGLVRGDDHIVLLQVRSAYVPVIPVVKVRREMAWGDMVCDLLLPVRQDGDRCDCSWQAF